MSFERILIIDPEECIDWRRCEPECPVEAIFPEDALPDKWEAFIRINYAYGEGAYSSTGSSTSTPPNTMSRTRRSKHVSRTLAPPARCERCGCQLSRYRGEDETLCWACRCGGAGNLLTAAEMSAEERERRVALLIAGHPLPVALDPVFRCPECGGIKLATSARCSRCRYRAEHPRKLTSDEALKGGPCPACGGRKNPKSRLCRACRYADQRLLFAGNPATTCPDCGGPKTRNARRCRKCRNRHEFGTVYRGGRPIHLTCPECGGPKKHKQARRCQECARRARLRKQASLQSGEDVSGRRRASRTVEGSPGDYRRSTIPKKTPRQSEGRWSKIRIDGRAANGELWVLWGEGATVSPASRSSTGAASPTSSRGCTAGGSPQHVRPPNRLQDLHAAGRHLIRSAQVPPVRRGDANRGRPVALGAAGARVARLRRKVRTEPTPLPGGAAVALAAFAGAT